MKHKKEKKKQNKHKFGKKTLIKLKQYNNVQTSPPPPSQPTPDVSKLLKIAKKLVFLIPPSLQNDHLQMPVLPI